MKLEKFLANSGQTLSGFAEKVGVSEASMGRYAAGKRVPRPAETHENCTTAPDFILNIARTASSPVATTVSGKVLKRSL